MLRKWRECRHGVKWHNMTTASAAASGGDDARAHHVSSHKTRDVVFSL